MKPKTLFFSSLVAAAAMSTVPAWATNSTYDATNKKIDWVSSDNAYKWVGSSSGAFATATNWVTGTGLNGTPTWTTTNKAPARSGNGYLLYFDGTSQTISVSGGSGSDSIATSDGGGIWVTGTGNTVTASLGNWAGSIQVEAGNVLNTSWITKLKDGHIVANGTVNITSGNLNFDGNGERTWFVGADGSITFGTATEISNGTIKLLGEVDTLSSGITNRTSTGTTTLTKQLVTFSAGITNTGNLDLLTVDTISDATSGSELIAVTSKDSLTEGQYYAEKTSSGVKISYVAKAYETETLTWAGTESSSVWVNKGTNWTNSDGVQTSFLNGDNVVFNANASATITSFITAGTVSVSAGTVSLVNQQFLTADSIDIADGATLNLGNLENGIDVSHKLTGTGTVVIEKTGTGKNHGQTINLGTEFAGTVNYTGNLDPTNVTSFGSASATVNFNDVYFWSNKNQTGEIAYSINFSGTGNKIEAEATAVLNLTGPITFSSGATFTVVKGTLNVSGAVTNGNFTQTGGTLNFTGEGKNTISTLTQSGGTLNFSGTGTTTLTNIAQTGGTFELSAGTLNISGTGTNTISTLTQTGGELNISDSTSTTITTANLSGGTISGGDIETAKVTGGTVNFSGKTALTNLRISQGTVNVSSVLNVSGSANNIAIGSASFFLNESGTGTLNVKTGGVVNVNSAHISVRDGTGTLNVETGGEINFGTGLNVTKNGNWGAATFNLNGGRINVGSSGIQRPSLSVVTYNFNSGTIGSLADSWSSTENLVFGGAITIDTAKKTINESGAATDAGTSSAITLSGGLTFSGDDSALVISGNGSVTLGGTVSGATADSAAKITVNSGSKLTLDASSLVYALTGSTDDSIDGKTLNIATGDGTILTTGTLSRTNFTWNGFALAERTKVSELSNGSVSVSFSGAAYNLFWKSGTSGTWDTSTTDVWGNGSATGGSETFVSGDNVTFDTDSAVAVTVSSSGVTAGTMTVSAGTVTLSGGNVTANTADITAGTLVLSSATKLTTVGGITVNDSGTLKISSNTSIGGNVTVNSGGTFDVNGSTSDIGSNIGTITLAGGTLTNTGSGVGTNLKQLYTLAVTADSEINGTGNFGLIGSQYAATTLTLNGKTLTKKGTNTFWLANTTVSAGTLKISEGTVDSYGKNINGSAADFVIESAGTLNMRAGTLSANSISGAGTINFGALSNLPTTFTTDWTGTVAFTSISNVSGVGLTLSNLGNSNSKIVFDGVSGTGTGKNQGLWFVPGNTYDVNIEIAAGGLTLTNGSSTTAVGLSGALSGTGTFNFAGTVTQAFKFTGNLSDFTGTLKSTTATFEFAGTKDQTFKGSIVGDGTTGAKITKSGSTKLTLAGPDTSINANTLTVSGGELEISSGTITLANAISNSGTVTVGSGAVFVLADALKNSGTDNEYTVISGGTISGWNSLGLSNFRQADGSEFYARSTVDVATAGVVKISDTAWNLYWKGGTTAGTWNTLTATNWGKESVDGANTAFVTGDNAVFNTSGASVSLGEAITAGTVTVSANTTITATSTNTLTADSISVTAGTLTLSGQQYVSASSINIESGATLDLGNLVDGTNVSKNLAGTGTVSISKTSGNHGQTINLGTEFAGTVNYSGNLNPKNATFGSSDATVNFTGVWFWSNGETGTIAQKLKFFGTGNKSNNGTLDLTGDISFDSGALFTVGGGTVNISGAVTNGNFTQTAGVLNFSGTGKNTIETLNVKGGGTNFSGTGTTTITGNISVSGGATVEQSAGTVSATRIVLNDSSAKTASFYTLSGGVLNVTGTGKQDQTVIKNSQTEPLTADNAILIGHWNGGTSILKVSDGVLNATSGFTTISWDSAGTLTVSGGEANLYGISLNTNRGNAANLTLSGNGRLNIGAGGLVYHNNTDGTNSTSNKTVTLSGGTLGALEDWSSAVAISVAGNVAIDTTKMSANTEGTAKATSTGATIALNGVLSGDGGLSKSGTGTLKLSGDNSSLTGGVTLSAGTLELGHNNALGATTSTLEVTGSSTLTLGSGLNVANTIASHGGGLTLTFNSAGDAELSGVLAAYYSGTTEVKKTGAGTLTLSGDNSAFMHGTISVEEGTLLAKSANALGTVTTATDNAVRLSGGTLKVGSGVTLAQTNIEIALSDAYATSAAIIGESDSAKLAEGTKISIISIDGGADIAVAAIAVSTVSSQYNYKIADTILGGRLTLDDFSLSSELQDEGWKIAAYSSESGVLTLTIPEPSTFGLLAGVGALALVAARRRRRAK